MVSIHAPGWARPTPAVAFVSLHKFQFTRPGGRDRYTPLPVDYSVVSIHAPGWARQRNGIPNSAPDSRFNSRARVGATKGVKYLEDWLAFQFTRPGGRDLA